jgi:hypothetical protein
MGTEHQIKEAYQVHFENTGIWHKFQATDKLLKQLLLGAVGDLYTSALKHRVTGFTNISTRHLIEHLYTNYGNITAGNLKANEKCTENPFNTSEPIEARFTQLELAINFADAAGTRYSVNQLITTAYNLVFKTGLSADTCWDWRRCPLPPKKRGPTSKPTSSRPPKIFKNQTPHGKPLATMAPMQPSRTICTFEKKPLPP